MKRYLAAVIIGIGLVLAASAQSARERSAFTYTHEGPAKTEQGGEIELREVELRTGFPIYRGPSVRVMAGVRWTRYDFSIEEEDLADFTAHSLRFPIRAVGPEKGGWRWMNMIAPAIRSDLESVSSDDLGVSAMSLASRDWARGWRLSLGAVYSQDFGRSRLFPAIGALWTNEVWTVDVQFPRPRLIYRATDSLSFGVGLEPGGDEWNVELAGTERDVALKEYRAGLGVEWSPVRNLSLQAQAGGVFGREIDVRGGGEPRLERDLDETWYARLALIFR